MKHFLVLGHKGMLGQMVVKYFKAMRYEVSTLETRFDAENYYTFCEQCADSKYDVVINCIGRIKQKTDRLDDLVWANATLPLALAQHLRKNQVLIQPSTDCVFDGLSEEPYLMEQTPNAKDAYGWSKALGEQAIWARKNTILFRVSIIGLDNNPEGKGLLNWFLSNPSGSRLNGFINHFWNGITTLEWCKQVHQLLKEDAYKNQTLIQGGTEQTYSKYEMLRLFNEVFSTNYLINRMETPNSVDRRLQPSLVSKSLEDQLKELRSSTIFSKEGK